MKVNQKRIHNYGHLFVVTLLFSGLASIIFVIFSLLRKSGWFESAIVATASCIFFSALGQRLSQIRQVGRGILFTSVVSIWLNYLVFVSPTVVGRIPSFYLWFAIAFSSLALVGWDYLGDLWEKLSQREITRRWALFIIGGGVPSVVLVIFIVTHFSEILLFFDTHPWAMTLISVLVSFLLFLGGMLVGRKTKE